MSPLGLLRRCLLLLSVLPAPGLAAPPPSGTCVQAAAAAERRHALPEGMLAAIGRVETGDRLTPAWPWSINADGVGWVASSRQQAVAQVQALYAQGARDIDVGCFQISLRHHPHAFPDLQAAFDPAMNAQYAAGFLASLYRRTGSWDAAIMAYHAAQPARGAAYRDKVVAAWGGPTGSRMLADAVKRVVVTPSPDGRAPTVIRFDAPTLNTIAIITPIL